MRHRDLLFNVVHEPLKKRSRLRDAVGPSLVPGGQEQGPEFARLLEWRTLEAWWAEGRKRFVGRAPTPADLIVRRQDGTQRRKNMSLRHFYADLEALGLPRRRQYESRAAFRNLCLRVGAPEFHVKLITHPKATSASELCGRLEDQWEAMCKAVLFIDAGAWDLTPGPVPAQPDRTVVAQEKAPKLGSFGALGLAGCRGLEGFEGW
jgi:hypothetical protein